VHSSLRTSSSLSLQSLSKRLLISAVSTEAACTLVLLLGNSDNGDGDRVELYNQPTSVITGNGW
jgi:hypothetical protein